MKIQAALTAAVQQLSAAGIEGAGRDARALLAWVLDMPGNRVTLCLNEEITGVARADLDHAIARRVAHEPVSKIIGSRMFWGRRFRVDGDVLDPRPETECLIAEVLDGPPVTRVLDLGTGTGILAITILAERPGAAGIATDLSLAALAVAAANARDIGVQDRLELVQSDWFDAISGRFDLILSNPPYIAALEMAGLSPEVRDHDPVMALSDGADGLSAYRAISAGAGAHLVPGGRLMVEIGWTQGAAVADMFHTAGFQQVEIRPDLDGRDRIVGGIWPG